MRRLFTWACLLGISGGVPAQYLVRYDVPGATATYWQLRGRDTIPVRLIPVAPGKTINLELRNLPGTFREQVEYRLEQARSEPVQNPWWPAGVSEGGASSFAAMLPSRTKLMQAFPGGETDAIRKNVEVGGITTAWSRYVNAWNIYMKRYDAWLEAVLFESACTELYRDLQTVRYSLSDNPEKAREEVLQRTEGLFPGVRENPLLFTRQSLATVSSGTLADSLLNFYAPLRELQPFLPAADSLQQMAFLRQQAVERFAGGEARGLPDVLIRRVGEAYRQLQRESYRRLLPLQVIPQTEAVVLRIWPEADSSVRELLRLPANDTFQRIIPLVRKKPLRFRNSFGMSFVQFSDSRWNYFVRTGSVNVIDREKADFFRPVVATLLHFYAPRDRGFRWGGSIGAGLPLTGDDRNLNILMGLSTFLGREDPISITLGLSGAQVNHLSRYRLGDVVTITELNPKTDFTAVYRLGFFIGITFNPSGLNANN